VHTSDVVFTIWELESMRPLGNAGLHQISLVHDTAFFGIFIGDPDAWGKGYGTEVTRLVLGYGFDVLGLHNIRLEVFSNNPRAVRVYERAGFKHAGTIRGGRKVGRERHDIIMMDAVADDFPPSALHETMQP
jgi:RimJ/RimL family protein N-acetyltransferase